MKTILILLIPVSILLAACRTNQPKAVKVSGVTGTVYRYHDFPSKYVRTRMVDVWLPPDYEEQSNQKYPVIYMNDGQNLFDPSLSYSKIDWGIDETMTNLIKTGKIHPAIVVGIWNTPKRMNEYMPQRPLEEHEDIYEQFRHDFDGPSLSDNYLLFIVNELRPFINNHYRVKADQENTFIMGSSMGGLISAYAVCEYPGLFKGAGCLSTHWPIADSVTVTYLRDHLPNPENHEFYFDHGTKTLDAEYEPFQKVVDNIMLEHNYQEGINLMSKVFPGDDHSEKSWRSRVDIPLKFFLGVKPQNGR